MQVNLYHHESLKKKNPLDIKVQNIFRIHRYTVKIVLITHRKKGKKKNNNYKVFFPREMKDKKKSVLKRDIFWLIKIIQLKSSGELFGAFIVTL